MRLHCSARRFVKAGGRDGIRSGRSSYDVPSAAVTAATKILTIDAGMVFMYIPGIKGVVVMNVGGFTLGEIVALILATPVQVRASERVPTACAQRVGSGSTNHFRKTILSTHPSASCLCLFLPHSRPPDPPPPRPGPPPPPHTHASVCHRLDVPQGRVPGAAPWPRQHGRARVGGHQCG